MGILETAVSPWGQTVPIHAAFYLIWVAAIAGLGFLVVHAIWFSFFMKKQHEEPVPAAIAANVPAEVPRHSLAARLFHWIMALSMITLLLTAFLPKIGVQFAWVEWHWMAGLLLTASILFHIIHATFVMDFWSIWPDRIDIEDAMRRFKRARGESAPAPRKFAKYPLENKMYHLAIVLTGLSVALTGVFMMKRVRTPFFTRNPYLFGDMTWGMMYVLHGLAGISLIALIIIHIYFAVRPEKLVITRSMLVGTLKRDHYLEHHDPERWAATKG